MKRFCFRRFVAFRVLVLILIVMAGSLNAEVKISGSTNPRLPKKFKETNEIRYYDKITHMDYSSPYFSGLLPQAIVNNRVAVKLPGSKKALYSKGIRALSKQAFGTGSALNISQIKDTKLFALKISPRALKASTTKGFFTTKEASLGNTVTMQQIAQLFQLFIQLFLSTATTTNTTTGTDTNLTFLNDLTALLNGTTNAVVPGTGAQVPPRGTSRPRQDLPTRDVCSPSHYWNDDKCCYGTCKTPGGLASCKASDGSCIQPGSNGQGFVSCGGSSSTANCAERVPFSGCPSSAPYAYSCEDLQASGRSCPTNIRGTICLPDANLNDGLTGTPLGVNDYYALPPARPVGDQDPVNDVTCYGNGGRVCESGDFDPQQCGFEPCMDRNGNETGKCGRNNNNYTIPYYGRESGHTECCSNQVTQTSGPHGFFRAGSRNQILDGQCSCYDGDPSCNCKCDSGDKGSPLCKEYCCNKSDSTAPECVCDCDKDKDKANCKSFCAPQ